MAPWIRYWAAKTEACTASRWAVRILLSRDYAQDTLTGDISDINQYTRVKIS